MQLYDIFLQHPIITTDSRNCPENSLFFALKGENFDANAFALSALEKVVLSLWLTKKNMLLTIVLYW